MRKTKNKVYHFTLSGGDVLRVFIFFYVVFFSLCGKTMYMIMIKLVKQTGHRMKRCIRLCTNSNKRKEKKGKEKDIPDNRKRK
jgi:hypothetical protein